MGSVEMRGDFVFKEGLVVCSGGYLFRCRGKKNEK